MSHAPSPSPQTHDGVAPTLFGKLERIAAAASIFIVAALGGGLWGGNSTRGNINTGTPRDFGNGTGYAYDDPQSQSYCFANGSLHQLALDQFHHSSPPASASYKKLKNVLDMNTDFHIDMGNAAIFAKNQESLLRMLKGYGLRKLEHKPSTNVQNVTLVETIFTGSACPTTDENCRDQPRILIQTEQYWKPPVLACHSAPNCAILDFSDYNLYKASQHTGAKNLEQSFVMLPVMTQIPSRISMYEPAVPKDLQSRDVDMVFFGLMTNRRNALNEGKRAYLEAHPDRKVVVQKSHNPSYVAAHYANAKVCLLAHSYSTRAGGEYHRISEFAPFGCIPVMEHFKDRVGTKVWERCAGAVFEKLQNLTSAAEEVVAEIDQGRYNARGHAIVDWWKAGIHWEIVLPTVFGGRGKAGEPPNSSPEEAS